MQIYKNPIQNLRIGSRTPSQLLRNVSSRLQKPQISIVPDPYDIATRRKENQTRLLEQKTMYSILDPIVNKGARDKLSHGAWYDDIPVIREIATTVHGYADIAKRMYDIRDPQTMLMTNLRFLGDSLDLASSLTIKPFLHMHQHERGLGSAYKEILGMQDEGRYNYWFGDYNETIDWLPENWATDIIGEMLIDPSVWWSLGAAAIPKAAGAGAKAAKTAAKTFAKEGAEQVASKAPKSGVRKIIGDTLDDLTSSYAGKFSRSHMSAFIDPVENSAQMHRANMFLWKGNRDAYKKAMLSYKRQGIISQRYTDDALDTLYNNGMIELGSKRLYRALNALDDAELALIQRLKKVTPINITRRGTQKAYRSFKYRHVTEHISETAARIKKYDSVNSFEAAAQIDEDELNELYIKSLRELKESQQKRDSEAYEAALENLMEVEDKILLKRNYEEHQYYRNIIDTTEKKITQKRIAIRSREEELKKLRKGTPAYKRKQQQIYNHRHQMRAQQQILESARMDLSARRNFRKHYNTINETVNNSGYNKSIYGRISTHDEFEKFKKQLAELDDRANKSPQGKGLDALMTKKREIQAALDVYESVQELLKYAMQSKYTQNYFANLLSMKKNKKLRALVIDMSRDHFKKYEAIVAENRKKIDRAVRQFSKQKMNIDDFMQGLKYDSKKYSPQIEEAISERLKKEFLDSVDQLTLRDRLFKAEKLKEDNAVKNTKDLAAMLRKEYDYADRGADRGFLGGFLEDLHKQVADAMEAAHKTGDVDAVAREADKHNKLFKRLFDVLGSNPEVARLYKSIKTLNNFSMSSASSRKGLKFVAERGNLKISNLIDNFKRVENVVRSSSKEFRDFSYNKRLQHISALLHDFANEVDTLNHKELVELLSDEAGKYHSLRKLFSEDVISQISDGKKIDPSDVDTYMFADIINTISPKQRNMMNARSIANYINNIRNGNVYAKEIFQLDYMLDLFRRTNMIVKNSDGVYNSVGNYVRRGPKELQKLVKDTYSNLKRNHSLFNRANDRYHKYLNDKSGNYALIPELQKLIKDYRPIDSKIADNFLTQHLLAIDMLRHYRETPVSGEFLGNFMKAIGPIDEVVSEDDVIQFYKHLVDDIHQTTFRMYNDALGIMKNANYNLKVLQDYRDAFLRSKVDAPSAIQKHVKKAEDDIRRLLKNVNMGKVMGLTSKQKDEANRLYNAMVKGTPIDFNDEIFALIHSIQYAQEYQPIYEYMQRMHVANFLIGGELEAAIKASNEVIRELSYGPGNKKVNYAYLERQFNFIQDELDRFSLDSRVIKDHVRTNSKRKVNNIFNTFMKSKEGESDNYIFHNKFHAIPEDDLGNNIVYDMYGEKYNGDLNLKDASYIFLDTETTGLSENDQVFQVAVTKVFPDGRREVHNLYLDIDGELSGAIKTLTGHEGSAYRDNLAKQQSELPDNEAVQKLLGELIDDQSVLFIQNAQFDMSKFQQLFGENLSKLGANAPVIDTLPLMKLHATEAKNRFHAALKNTPDEIADLEKTITKRRTEVKHLQEEIDNLRKSVNKTESYKQMTVRATTAHEFMPDTEVTRRIINRNMDKDLDIDKVLGKENESLEKMIVLYRRRINELLNRRGTRGAKATQDPIQKRVEASIRRKVEAGINDTLKGAGTRNVLNEFPSSLRNLPGSEDYISQVSALKKRSQVSENLRLIKEAEELIEYKQNQLEHIRQQVDRYDSIEKYSQDHLVEQLIPQERLDRIKAELQDQFGSSNMQQHNALFDIATLEELINNFDGPAGKTEHRMLSTIFDSYEVEKISDLNNRNVGVFNIQDKHTMQGTISELSSKTKSYKERLELLISTQEDERVYDLVKNILDSISEVERELRKRPVDIDMSVINRAMVEFDFDENDIRRIIQNMDDKTGTPIEFNVQFSDSANASELLGILDDLETVREQVSMIKNRSDQILDVFYGDSRAQLVDNKLMNNFRLMSEYVNNDNLHRLHSILEGEEIGLIEDNDRRLSQYFKSIIDEHARTVGIDPKSMSHQNLLKRYRKDNDNALTRFYDFIEDVDNYIDFNRRIYGDLHNRLKLAKSAEDKEMIRVGFAKVNEFMNKLERRYKQIAENAKFKGELPDLGEFDSAYYKLLHDPEMSPLIKSNLFRKDSGKAKMLHEYTGLNITEQIEKFVRHRIRRFYQTGNDMRLFLNIDTATSNDFYHFFKQYMLDPLYEVTKTSSKVGVDEATSVITKDGPEFLRLKEMVDDALGGLRKPLAEIKYENMNAPTYHVGAINKYINHIKDKGQFYDDYLTSAELILRNEAKILRLTDTGKNATKSNRLINRLLEGLTDAPDNLNTYKSSDATNELTQKIQALIGSTFGDDRANIEVFSSYFRNNLKLTHQRIKKVEFLESLLSFESDSLYVRRLRRSLKDIEAWAMNPKGYIAKGADDMVDPKKADEFMQRLKASLFEYLSELEPINYKHALGELYSQGHTKKELFASKLRAMDDMKKVGESTQQSYDFLRDHFGRSAEGAQKMYKFISENPEDYSIIRFEFDSSTRSGVAARKVLINSPDDILTLDKQIAEMGDSFSTIGVVDQNTYYRLQRELGQIFKFKRGGIADTIRRHYLMPLKSLMLANANFVFTNVFDAVLKNLVVQEGGVFSRKNVLGDMVTAMRMHKHYDEVWYEASRVLDYDMLKFGRQSEWVDIYREHLKRSGKLTSEMDEKLNEVRQVQEFFEEPAASSQFQEMLLQMEGAHIGKGRRNTDFQNALNTVFYGGKYSPFAWNMNLNSRVEIYSRLALYLNDVRKGLSKNEALNKVLRTHFNYVDKSAAELKAEFIIPFMSYPIRNFLFWADAFHANPRQTRFMSKLITRSWGHEEMHENDYAKYSASRGQLPIGDYSVNLGLTWMDAMSVQGSIKEAPVPFSDQAVRKLNPVAKNLMDTERPMNERIGRIPGGTIFTNVGRSMTALGDGEGSLDRHLPAMFAPYYRGSSNITHRTTSSNHPQFSKPYSYNRGSLVPSASRSMRWKMTNPYKYKFY